MTFQQAANDLFDEALTLRRRFHENPELGYLETETSAFIEQYCADLGLEVIAGTGRTGIRAILRGEAEGPVVGLRTDMDALPIQEENDIPFSSKNPGIMHACGHDFHMANLLITAKIAAQMKEHIPGTIVFVFQPCEEGPPRGDIGGAHKMVKEGVLLDPDIEAMIGLHVFPGLPAGTAGFREGPFMSTIDFFYIDIKGKYAHGAYPHKGIDAIYGAALAIMEFQAVISRLKDPVEPAVLTVGKIEGGERENVLAGMVRMAGTVRTFSDSTRETVKDGMEAVLRSLNTLHGYESEMDYVNLGPYLLNNRALAKSIMPAMQRILGDENVIELPPQMVSEDFAYYSHQIPSFFFFLGVANNEKGYTSGLHTPTFMGDEDVLKIGPALMLEMAVEYMKRKAYLKSE